MSADFDFMSAVKLRRLIGEREVSPVELTRRALEKAAATQATLNAFFLLMPEKAMADAHAAEAAIMKGTTRGVLHGLPFSPRTLWRSAVSAMLSVHARWPTILRLSMHPP